MSINNNNDNSDNGGGEIGNNTHDTMQEFHSLLVQAMAKKLKSGEEVKAPYLDTVRKFLLDNDVRVEDPQDYLGQLEGMMGNDGDESNSPDTPPTIDVEALFMKQYGEHSLPQDIPPDENGMYNGFTTPEIAAAYAKAEHAHHGRTGTEKTHDGYGFQR